MIKYNTSIIFFSFFLSITLNSQNIPNNNLSDCYNRYGLRYYTGKIFAHAKDVENTAGSRPYSIEFEYSKRHIGLNVWNLCRCYPTTGYLLALKNYDNKILGKGIHLAYFVQYHFFQKSSISPAIRGSAGLEYSTNPYHKTNNPDNQSYSLYLNFYLQIAMNIDIRINKNLFTDISFGFNHISNSGYRMPNRGINWPSLSLGLHYSPNFSSIINRRNIIPQPKSKSMWVKRPKFYISGISETFDEKERFLIYGAEFVVGRKINNLNMILGGLEWNLDMSSKRKIEYYDYNYNPNRLSFLAGHEFIMGNFGFSQKIGVYFFDSLKQNSLIYHKWGIKYVHNSKLLIGIELKAHKHVAEFACFKIGWDI